MSTPIQLLEIEAWDGAAVQTLRLATHNYVTARSDTPADTPYQARITEPVVMTRNAWAADTTRQDSALSLGSVTVANADGGLDDWIGYAYAGRPVTLRQVLPGAPLASAVVLFEGLMEQPQFDWEAGAGGKGLVFIIRDRAFPIAVSPIQATRYGGTNSLPSGVDGTAELAGKGKPRLFGYAARIPAPSVNTARLIYQVNDGTVADVSAVYDKGLALGRGADYASQADMETNNPAAGTYRAWRAGGMFRLGSTPAGSILCDASEGATAALRYPGALAQRVLLAAGVSPGELDTASFTTIDAACPWECGYWAGTNDILPSEILDALMTSVGGWWSATAGARFRVGELSSPSGSPVLTLDKNTLISLTRRQAKDADRGVPAWKVDVGYARYWATNADTASAVAQAVRDDLAQEYRRTASTDAAIQTAYPASPAVSIDTLLRDQASAAALASARLGVLKVRRSVVQAVARLDAYALIPDVGDVVRLQFPRYGHAAGVLYRVLGVVLDARINRLTLTLWG